MTSNELKEAENLGRQEPFANRAKNAGGGEGEGEGNARARDEGAGRGAAPASRERRPGSSRDRDPARARARANYPKYGNAVSLPAMTKAELDPTLYARLRQVMEEGRDFYHTFDLEVRQKNFHPFVPANYDQVLDTLLAHYQPGLRFLEWGSGTGVITIMADMIGFEAYGIEIDAPLVDVARKLAKKYQSKARFAVGSFLPMGYEYRDSTGDTRTGTVGHAVSGYLELQHPLEDFDVVYGYPWPGEAEIMEDVMRQYGNPDATLLIQRGA